MLPEDYLDNLEERCMAATPGPWEWDEDDCLAVQGNLGVILEPIVSGSGRWKIQGSEVDREFIRDGRADIPRLLSEVRRLRDIERILRRLMGPGGAWRMDRNLINALSLAIYGPAADAP